MATEAPARPRLKEKYRAEIAPALKDEFGYANVMQIPGLTKIVVNMGVGEAARDAKLIDGAVRDLAAITGQKPAVARAKKSIAQFKLREGMPIGAHVTLRGDRMWEFLDRLLATALPRIRDFRGLNPRQFDGKGNYTFGLTEQVMFHEIDPDKVDRQRGMDITLVTTATNDDEGRALLRLIGFPFAEAGALPVKVRKKKSGPGSALGRGASQWLRRRWSSRRTASRSSKSGPTRGAPAVAARAPSTGSSACAGSASARWPTAANCPASRSPAGKNLYAP